MNNGYNIQFNIDDLRAMKKEMLDMCNQLEASCKECYRKIDESKRVYDTSTGDYFREKANEYVLKHHSYINDVVIPYVNELDKIINEYETMLIEIKSTVESKVK